MLVVFTSVIWRYFLHDPLQWAEEIARALMVTQVFLGAAAVLGRAQHVGIDSFRGLFPASWRPAMIQLCDWIIVAVSVALFLSSCALFDDSRDQTTPIGLPQWIYVFPVVAGSLLMIAVSEQRAALAGPRRSVWGTLVAGLALALAVWALEHGGARASGHPGFLLVVAFVASLDHRCADRLRARVLGFAVFPGRPVAADAGVFAAGRCRGWITSFCWPFRSSCWPAW